MGELDGVMDASRLSSVSQNMVTRLLGCQAEELRRIADAAAVYALIRTGGVPSQVEDLRESLERGGFGDSHQRDVVAALVEEFDETYWAASDERPGSAGTLEAVDAFSRARALASAWSCAEPDPLQAALDACYEAIIACADVAALENVILNH